jgi:arginyl-tRNA synthetase
LNGRGETPLAKDFDMNLFADFELRIKAILSDKVLPEEKREGADLSRIVVEPPRDPAHGDLATNAAMVLSKAMGMNPRALADAIVPHLEADADIEAVSVAGPGFINIKLSGSYWRTLLAAVVRNAEGFGKSTLGSGRKTNVEYVSANPTGPMHVGHCRGAVVGDALANLMAFAGYEVIKEYYINDAGSQIDVLAKSAFLRYREALGEKIGEIPEGLYPGDYLVPVGEALKAEFGSKLRGMTEAEWMPVVKDRTIDAMMAMIREDLAALNIHHDVFFSERTLHEGNGGAILSAINDLTYKGYVYKGKIPPPKGELAEDWEDREQTLFRSTEVGDDIDRPLMKDKYDRGFTDMIYVLGADHGGYVKRLEAVAKAISGGKAKLTVLLCQLVKLYKNGEPFKMSKRAGTFVTLRDVVDEVGSDAVRFMMIYRKNSEPLDFDFAKVTETSKDNPVFYVQYAHARCRTVFRRALEAFPDLDISDSVLAEKVQELITDPSELQLVAKLAEFPRLVESAAAAMEPHRIAYYLYDLANALHSHYDKGNKNAELRFVKDNDRELTLARLGLVRAVAAVLKSGLSITGTSAPEEMR